MMNIVRKGLHCAAGAALLLAGTAGWASPPFRQAATPGTRHYFYTVLHTTNGAMEQGYRVGFDLVSDADGSVDAIVLSSESLAGGRWTQTIVDPACRTAMRGTADSLARVRLWPLAQGAAARLGSDFLDTCAPPAIFFPLTDILNAVIVPLSPTFGAAALRRQGQSEHYPGFTAAYDRAGESLHEVVDGGELRLATLDRRQAVIDWMPQIATLDLVERSGASPVTLHGTEHWSFRIVLDRRTGAILDAHTLYDNLDLAVLGVPGAPRVAISRMVTITPR
jgi:hypothetical protein